MKLKITTLLTTLAFLALSGCAAGGGPEIQGSHAKGEAAVGAGLGALIGGVIGHHEGNTAAGVVIGGLVGGTVGYLHGREEDLARARMLAAQARKDGYSAQVQAATVSDPQTHAQVQVFRGFKLAVPVKDISRNNQQSLVMLRQCGALALKEHTDVNATGPARVQPVVTSALELPAQRVRYQSASGTPDVHVAVLARQS